MLNEEQLVGFILAWSLASLQLDIKFCEVLGSAELGDELGDEGKGVSVLNGYSVQHTIVLDQPEQAIFLLNEEHRGCYGGFGRLDLSGMQVFLQEGVQLSLFQWCYTANEFSAEDNI